tara:strand:+ start:246 stop:467 length:222 start_codon:yes stop_codon:yes gene_type:complete
MLIVLTPRGCPGEDAEIETEGTDPAPRFAIVAPMVTVSPTCGIGVESVKLSASTAGSGVRSFTLTPLSAMEYG